MTNWLYPNLSIVCFRVQSWLDHGFSYLLLSSYGCCRIITFQLPGTSAQAALVWRSRPSIPKSQKRGQQISASIETDVAFLPVGFREFYLWELILVIIIRKIHNCIQFITFLPTCFSRIYLRTFHLNASICFSNAYANFCALHPYINKGHTKKF